MSITIDIDEQLLADLGRDEVEREFKKTIERLELRKLARQMANDLKDIDHSNDPDWQKAREEAWNEYRQRNKLAADGSRQS